ncbi:MAG: twin-arginine translocase TatA/TatE family subunit [Candidatus Omnitrophota bacterium]
MGRIGLPELLIILFIILLLFGAAKLPQLSKSIVKSLTEFKKGISEKKENDDTSS